MFGNVEFKLLVGHLGPGVDGDGALRPGDVDILGALWLYEIA